MCLTICIYCDQTTPWQGVYFLPILFKRELIHYTMCHSNFIVLLPHISPWTQIWIQAFIVAYQNLTFKSVKQKLLLRIQKSALRCSKVSSGSEKRLHQIDQSECNIFCQKISNSNLNWYIYKWINTKVKCIVHMGLSKVKILRKPVG